MAKRKAHPKREKRGQDYHKKENWKNDYYISKPKQFKRQDRGG